MKKTILIAFILFCTSIMKGQELMQQNDETTVVFKIKNLGVNVNGTFSKILITSNFNKNNLANSYLHAKIEVATIDAGIAGRNKSLAKKDYFDVDNYPYITLQSTKITKKTDTEYLLTGKLVIKGTEKMVEIPLFISETNDKVIINSDFELNRLDYNVGKKSWVMSNTVKIKVHYVAKK